ncbi:wd40 repeat-containing protein [Stylonychia lemnae]|uniref:Wd40 repeat-containing protein n=1 Tax=Stylonychia lemnae TaxID=5949 RepID=A0A078AB05_STYLE|nr:wd40 repeat-containing protein [Stylonychia lemnae]|eukprot:CDW77963.1 wd40 repeat-containing protein [Stylonychia lemnae]
MEPNSFQIPSISIQQEIEETSDIQNQHQSENMYFEASKYKTSQTQSIVAYDVCQHLRAANSSYSTSTNNIIINKISKVKYILNLQYSDPACISQSKLKIRQGLIEYIGKNWTINANDNRDSNQNSQQQQQQQQNQRIHDGCIFALEIDQSGTYLAVSNEQSQIFFWNLRNKKFLKRVKEHSEFVTSLQFFHHQQNMFYSSSLDRTIRLWRDYESIDIYTDHQDWIRTMSLSNQDRHLISGCVSSQIFCWDPLTGKPLVKINNTNQQMVQQQSESYLNTINCLCFGKSNEEVFVAGSRDGIAKIYDLRCNPHTQGAQITFRAHNNKLNQIIFSKYDSILLSSGRDNSIRLWDIRFVQDGQAQIDPAKENFVMQYIGHKCQGYNIGAHFFDNENKILTGSEDGFVYCYDKMSGQIQKKIQCQSKVIHLVKPVPFGNQLEFIQTGLEEGTLVNLWGISQNKIQEKAKLKNQDYNTNQEATKIKTLKDALASNIFSGPQIFNQSQVSNDGFNSISSDNEDGLNSSLPNNDEFRTLDETDEDFRSQIYLCIIEEIMQEYGDLILKVFHKHNFTYCTTMDWQALIQTIEEQEDQESQDLLKILNEQLVKKIISVYNEFIFNPQAVKDKYLFKHSNNKDEGKPKRETIIIKHQCSQCEVGANDGQILSPDVALGKKEKNNHSAIKGILNKLFGNFNMYDQREDSQIEKKKIQREILSNFPSEGALTAFHPQYDIEIHTFDNESNDEHFNQKEESKIEEGEKFQEMPKQLIKGPYELKILRNFTIDEQKRKRLIAFSAFQL